MKPLPHQGITINDRPRVSQAQLARNRRKLQELAAEAKAAVYLDRDGRPIGTIKRGGGKQ